MGVPWLRIIDTIVGVTDLARSRASAARAPEGPEIGGTRALGALETRLAGVVVAALKEAFDRDSRRLELERDAIESERQRIEADRQRAERALHLELLRQSGEREIGRMRLVAGVAVASWLGTLFFSARLIGASVGARLTLGAGWVLLLAALATAFVAQSRVGDALTRVDQLGGGRDQVSSGAAGALAPWLVVVGLALVGVAVLVA